MIRNLSAALLLASALALVLLAASPVSAQSAASATAGAGPGDLSPVYDLAKEISVQGTIEKIETVTSGGLLGTHLHIRGPQGTVDVHLGSSAVARAKTLGLSTGQSVSVTGMMAGIEGSDVLLARVLTTSNHIFILRNEHGLPVRSLVPRRGASSPATEKGGL